MICNKHHYSGCWMYKWLWSYIQNTAKVANQE